MRDRKIKILELLLYIAILVIFIVLGVSGKLPERVPNLRDMDEQETIPSSEQEFWQEYKEEN